MIKTKVKQITAEILEDVICDSCGKSCHNGSNFEYITLKNYWGYGSKKDTEFWEAHICEKCTDEKLNFIKFRKDDYGIYGEHLVERKTILQGTIILIEKK